MMKRQANDEKEALHGRQPMSLRSFLPFHSYATLLSLVCNNNLMLLGFGWMYYFNSEFESSFV